MSSTAPTHPRVAIVGSGISGLAVAHTLQGLAEVTRFEAGDYFGGHTQTVDITLPTPRGEVTHGVDTGFLVFNERTYPNYTLRVNQGYSEYPAPWGGDFYQGGTGGAFRPVAGHAARCVNGRAVSARRHPLAMSKPYLPMQQRLPTV